MLRPANIHCAVLELTGCEADTALHRTALSGYRQLTPALPYALPRYPWLALRPAATAVQG